MSHRVGGEDGPVFCEYINSDTVNLNGVVGMAGPQKLKLMSIRIN
jgi:hypothetical protein